MGSLNQVSADAHLRRAGAALARRNQARRKARRCPRLILVQPFTAGSLFAGSREGVPFLLCMADLARAQPRISAGVLIDANLWFFDGLCRSGGGGGIGRWSLRLSGRGRNRPNRCKYKNGKHCIAHYIPQFSPNREIYSGNCRSCLSRAALRLQWPLFSLMLFAVSF
jgi:hypothetical protein